MTDNTVAKIDSQQRKRDALPVLHVVMPVTKLFSKPTMQIIDGRLVAVVTAKPA